MSLTSPDKHARLYRAEQALKAWFEASGDNEPDQSNMTDLIAHLLLLAADDPEEHGTPAEVLASASMHFEHEREDQPDAEDSTAADPLYGQRMDSADMGEEGEG